MENKIFESHMTSMMLLLVVMISSFIYLFLPYEIASMADKEREIVFSVQTIIPFFSGVILYLAAIFLDINISKSIYYFDPDGLNNPIFTALSVLPLCVVMITFIIANNNFAVAPGLGWISGLIIHIVIHDLKAEQIESLGA